MRWPVMGISEVDGVKLLRFVRPRALQVLQHYDERVNDIVSAPYSLSGITNLERQIAQQCGLDVEVRIGVETTVVTKEMVGWRLVPLP